MIEVYVEGIPWPVQPRRSFRMVNECTCCREEKRYSALIVYLFDENFLSFVLGTSKYFRVGCEECKKLSEARPTVAAALLNWYSRFYFEQV